LLTNIKWLGERISHGGYSPRPRLQWGLRWETLAGSPRWTAGSTIPLATRKPVRAGARGAELRSRSYVHCAVAFQTSTTLLYSPSGVVVTAERSLVDDEQVTFRHTSGDELAKTTSATGELPWVRRSTRPATVSVFALGPCGSWVWISVANPWRRYANAARTACGGG